MGRERDPHTGRPRARPPPHNLSTRPYSPTSRIRRLTPRLTLFVDQPTPTFLHFMAPSLVSAPIQHSSQRSSPFPAYQAGPPTASPPRRAPSHAARQVSATKAEDVPHIKSPPIVGPSSGPARSDPPTSLPAKEVASALPSSSTSSFSVHPPQADARAHPTAAAKREKRRLKTAAKREKARSAAATTATAVDGAASAPVSKVVSSSVATKAARIKAPAGTSVEVREVLRWSSSSSPAPLSDELADGPAGACSHPDLQPASLLTSWPAADRLQLVPQHLSRRPFGASLHLLPHAHSHPPPHRRRLPPACRLQ